MHYTTRVQRGDRKSFTHS